MRLSVVAAIILVELGAGVLLLMPLVPIREVRKSYFTFHSVMSATCFAFAAAIQRFALERAGIAVAMLIAAAFCAWGFGASKLERFRDTRIAHVLAAVVAIFFCFHFLIGSGIILPEKGPMAGYAPFFGINLLLGTVLLGAAHNAMALGHWYLISRNLSFSYLIRITKVLLLSLGVRGAVLIGTLLAMSRVAPGYSERALGHLLSLNGDLPFFLMRVFWGIALPLVLAFLSLRCAVGKANQAATGLLYLCEMSVLFGELFAAYLMV
jgi:hypothetical protein